MLRYYKSKCLERPTSEKSHHFKVEVDLRKQMKAEDYDDYREEALLLGQEPMSNSYIT